MKTSSKKIIGFGMGLAIVCLTAQAAEQKPSASDHTSTQVGGFILKVANMAQSLAYYKMLGLEVTETRGKEPKLTYVFNVEPAKGKFRTPFGGGMALEEQQDGAAADPGAKPTRLYFIVSDVRALCKRLGDANMPCGGMEPTVVPQDGNAIIAITKDPNGYPVELIELPH